LQFGKVAMVSTSCKVETVCNETSLDDQKFTNMI